MANSRRDFLRLGLGTAAGMVTARVAVASPQQPMPGMPGMDMPAASPAEPASPRNKKKLAAARQHGRQDFLPVETPDLPKLPWTMEGGVKVFHLRAEVVKSQFVPWRTANTWGYNGSTPGPTIEVMEGDRVRIIVENQLPEGTTMHWHGLEVPIEMDGPEGVVQDIIPPGGRFVYEFTLHQHGTFFYHSHRPMQQMMGMMGLFIIHPKTPYEPRVDRDFAWILQEFAALPNNQTPNSLSMEFNWLTMNGKSAPATTPVVCRLGERVRVRFVNLGMDHHPMHIHGTTWVVTGTEGGRVPHAAWTPGNTEIVGVAQARTLEFVANNPGDWMLHCHLPHHMMNAMVSMVGPISNPAGGVPTGERMEDGMGMISDGHALAEKFGPSMGRTTGVDAESRVTNAPLDKMAQPGGGGEMKGMQMGSTPMLDGAPNARQVPGYPQDMFMVMDEMFSGKPETHGLRPTWTGGMMGMMTLVRVLKPEMFDKIQELRRRQPKDPAPAMTMPMGTGENHDGGGR